MPSKTSVPFAVEPSHELSVKFISLNISSSYERWSAYKPLENHLTQVLPDISILDTDNSPEISIIVIPDVFPDVGI